MNPKDNIGKIIEFFEDDDDNSFGQIIDAGIKQGEWRYLVEWSDGYPLSTVRVDSESIVSIR